jgi:DNA phosphorothioation-associated putative methyltransferase
MRQLVEADIITTSTKILDYGCGRGGDVSILRERGVNVTGYDPYGPAEVSEPPVGTFDVVTLLYVLNVIPTLPERIAALTCAWTFVRAGGRMIVVSRTDTEIRREATLNGWKPVGDGFLSSPSKGTFQKGHDRTALEKLLGTLPSAKVETPFLNNSRFSSAQVCKTN